MLEGFIAELERRCVKVVAFDMDQTMVAAHSGGRLRKSELEGFAEKATGDFLEAVPALLQRGFKVAVATHSDVVEYVGEVTRAEHLLGDDLASLLLRRLFPEQISEQIFIFAYNPSKRRDTANPGKLLHVRTIAEHYNVPTGEVVLFDDDERNIDVTSSLCHCFHVDPTTGFRFGHLTALAA